MEILNILIHINMRHLKKTKKTKTNYYPLLDTTYTHTLNIPPFCQAIFSIVSPRMLVWSMPSEEMPQTHGLLQGHTGRIHIS